MVRIAILGDFHFGYMRFYEDSFTQAREALQKAQEMADLIIIAGDIFDSRVPKPEVIEKAFEIFSKVDKKIFVIHGTHERRPKGFTTPVDLICKAGFAESCHNNYLVFEKEGEKVCVFGMGGVPEEYAKAALQKLSPLPREGMFNIFVFHQNLKELMPMVEHGLNIDDLPNGFDLYIDGHIHKNYELSKNGKNVIIPGSTVLTQLRGEEKEKGFYVYDTSERRAQFVSVPTRHFAHVWVRITGEDDAKQRISEEISNIDLSSKPIIRLDIACERDVNIAQEDVDYIRALYSDKAYLFINLPNKEIAWSDEDIVVENSASIRERGLNILKNIVKSKNIRFENVEEAFDMSCDASTDELAEYFIRVSKVKKDDKNE